MEELVQVMMQLIKGEICDPPSDVELPNELSDRFLEALYTLSKKARSGTHCGIRTGKERAFAGK